MVVINRKHKDSCENSRALTFTVYSEAQRTRVVNWDGHAVRPYAL